MKNWGIGIAAIFGLLTVLLLLPARGHAAERTGESRLDASRASFTRGEGGEFGFDTGVLRGVLRANGRSLGLSSVVHVPSGLRLDRSNGLLSYYRVFTAGKRYGVGAWDWPSTATLLDDGAVEVRWAPETNRPFQLRAIYRWSDATTLDVETIARAQTDLKQFEVFLASYFNEGFTNVAAYVKAPSETSNKPAFLEATRSFGDWLMYPRDNAATQVIRDGRWKLEPNPVDWKLMPLLRGPLGYRKEPKSGLACVLMAPMKECFALATPYDTEGHYSLYLSLFGGDVRAGDTVRARSRLWISVSPTDSQIVKSYRTYIRKRS